MGRGVQLLRERQLLLEDPDRVRDHFLQVVSTRRCSNALVNKSAIVRSSVGGAGPGGAGGCGGAGEKEKLEVRAAVKELKSSEKD